MKKIIITLLLLAAVGPATSQPSMHRRVEELLTQLTLDEKLSLLEHHNPALPQYGLPEYSWWNEALHGVARNGTATVYPMPIALAATFNPDEVQSLYESVALEALAKHLQSAAEGRRDDNTGLTFFAPNVNLFRDPRWGRGMETFGEDPYLTARMGCAVVRGLQSQPVVGACVKHFAAHSGPEATRHQFDASVDERDLWSSYLPAFEYIIRHAKPQMVMSGYNRLNGVPLSTNRWLMEDVLRRQWHYDGIVVTDCWALNDCWERDAKTPRHETHASAADAAADAFTTAVDLECGSGLPALRQAVSSGRISEEVIDAHLRRILPVRLRMMDYDYAMGDSLPAFTPYSALQASAASLVLLKNDGVLPLSSAHVALLGPNADDSLMALGNYNGTPRHTTTIREALSREQAPCRADASQQTLWQRLFHRQTSAPAHTHHALYYDRACNHADSHYSVPANFWSAVESQDVIVFVGGLSPTLEGEELQVEQPGFSRGDRTAIELPEVQCKMIKELKQRTSKPVVLVLCSGSAIALEKVLPYVDAVVVAWYGGEAMGQAVADALYGRTDFPGRLPVTFYRSTAQLPDYDDYAMEGRTYRYLDCSQAMSQVKSEPLFPFGYGLGYNRYRLDSVAFDAARLCAHGYVANVSAGNVPDSMAAATVQLYVTNLDDPRGPQRWLAGTCQIRVPKRGTLPFSIALDPDWLRYYSPVEHTLVPPARGTRFQVQIGLSSAANDLQTFQFTY